MKTDAIENEKKFITYLNYLTSLRDFIYENYQDYNSFGQFIGNSGSFSRIQGGHCLDDRAVERLLRNAWFTEVQLNLPKEKPEFITYSNHWAAVQLYYACFLSIRGFFMASGSRVDIKHTATLRTISSEIERRPSLFQEPISLLCKGDPEKNTEEYLNLPSEVTINRISSLTSSKRVSFYDSYCMLLRTTRKRQIEKVILEWKRHNTRKRIRKKERESCIDKIQPTSIFDVLYRLRIRSNYEDADLYLLNIEDQTNATNFLNCLTTVAWHTLFVLELIIAKYLRKSVFGRIVSDFLHDETFGFSANLLRRRWPIINNSF